MICLASSHNFAFVSTLGPIPEVTFAVRIMSAPPHQSQQSGLHYNLTQSDGCTINVNGTNNITYQQPVNEPAATERGGIGKNGRMQTMMSLPVIVDVKPKPLPG